MKGRGVFLQGFVLTSCAGPIAACSHQQIYDSTAELRAQDCRRLSDRERQDCEQSARDTSYKQYREAREEAVRGADRGAEGKRPPPQPTGS